MEMQHERHTKKDRGYYELYDEEVDDLYLDAVYSKLQKIENTEEELGCPLEVFYKAHCSEFIYDEKGNKYKVMMCYNNRIVTHQITKNKLMLDIWPQTIFLFKDYKEKWFLKNDKSE